MSLFQSLNAVPLAVLWITLFVTFAGSAAIGVWFGLRLARTEADKDANTMASAALGLLALLIAFTYSMAAGRYDLRRQVVLEEANAIGSTANFALMLPPSDKNAVLPLLRDFTQLRLGLGNPYDEALLARDVARSSALETSLWKQAVTLSDAQPQSLPGYRYIASLNEMNNVAEKRVTALRNHVPVVILLMLMGTAVVAMGFSGYSAGVGGRTRLFALGIMSALIAYLIVLTQDLARPDRGAILVPTQALTDTLNAIPEPPH